MNAPSLTLDAARGLELEAQVIKLLAPEEVAKHGVLPIALVTDASVLLVALDPTASERAEWFLRMRCDVHTVEAMPASRETVAHLLEKHFLPYWIEKGWGFPGLSPIPGAGRFDGPELVLEPNPLREPESEGELEPDREGTEAPDPEADPAADGVPELEPDVVSTLDTDRLPATDPVRPVWSGDIVADPYAPDGEAEDVRGDGPEEAGAKPAGGPSHPVVLVVDTGRARWRALAEILEEGGDEPRFAGKAEEVRRELRRSPPHLVIVRRAGPVSVEALLAIVRETNAPSELRVVPDYAQALLGLGLGDERLPRFIFDLTRFLLGVIAAAGGGRLDRTAARARHAERTARRLALSPPEIEAVRFAALLVDLDEILGSLRQEEGDVKVGSAMAMLEPLLAPDRTPFPVAAVLEAAMERYDGSGESGLRGETIPAGARVLAAVEAFLDLREEGHGHEAIEAHLRELSGTDLDPRMVEALLRTDRAERLVDLLDEDREQVLLVDPDPVSASLIEMRLANAGFGVIVHRDGTSALEAAEKCPPAIVLSEVAVPRMDGFTLLLRLRKMEGTEDVPFLFVSERTDRSATVRGLELGADDFLAKPVDLELLAAKVKGLVRKAQRTRPSKAQLPGVSGDLAELELVELLQVLAATGRTVRISLEQSGETVGEMSLEQGRIVHAVNDEMEGVAAFNALLTLTEGRFTVESSEPHSTRTIDVPLESLLLEACRQLDEASRESGMPAETGHPL